jgi:deazaflavin-dependent oxidoreductase (nitroreductase family)
MTKQYRVTWVTRLINRPFAWLARRGVGADYRYVLTVKGRRSGTAYSTPVDAIEHDGRRWLVAAYGVTNWVRNARAAGEVQLSRGTESSRLRIREADPEEAAPVIRRYLELVPVTRPYFAVGRDAQLEALAAEAGEHPVFELEPRASVATRGT